MCTAPVREAPRVLVAEDDAAMRALVAEALRRDGCTVIEAADGGRLLVALARKFGDAGEADLVDLVISDIRMPICTGMQILEQVRAARWQVPFILMTAFGDSVAHDHARSLGALLFDKPFQVDELRRAVATLLRHRV